jgi:hypothetical protein
MKKTVIFVILAMLVICSCTAQSANSDAQRLVGTWIGEYRTYVLNADGTGTFTSDGNTTNIFWGFSAAEGRIKILNRETTPVVFLSPDGKRMIIDSTVLQKK